MKLSILFGNLRGIFTILTGTSGLATIVYALIQSYNKSIGFGLVVTTISFFIVAAFFNMIYGVLKSEERVEEKKLERLAKEKQAIGP